MPNTKIIQEFVGFIGDVKFNDKSIFYSTEFICEQMETSFEIVVPNNFIATIRDIVENLYLKASDFSLADIEQFFYTNIESAESLEELQFNDSGYLGYGYLEALNTGLKNGYFAFEHVLIQGELE